MSNTITDTKKANLTQVIANIRDHIDKHLDDDRSVWYTRHANTCLMAREECYAVHADYQGYDWTWHKSYRADASEARRPGTRWNAITNVLITYVVDQIINHTSMWRCWHSESEKALEDFVDALGDNFIEHPSSHAFEAPYVEYARQYAYQQVSDLLNDDGDARIVSHWTGTPIKESEINGVLIAAQLVPPVETGDSVV